jgi:quinoprotein glucose dehydrogenase
MRSATRLCLAALFATTAATGVLAQDAVPDGDWRTINRDLAATRYSPLADINTGNVSRLQQAWTYQLRGFNTAVPLVVDGVMYLPAPTRVVALDAATGREIWVHNGPGGQGNNYASRGVGYWPGEGNMGPRILVMQGSDLIALDAATGELVPTFGNNGVVELDIGFGGAPSIGGHVAIIGASSLENPRGVAGGIAAAPICGALPPP